MYCNQSLNKTPKLLHSLFHCIHVFRQKRALTFLRYMVFYILSYGHRKTNIKINIRTSRISEKKNLPNVVAHNSRSRHGDVSSVVLLFLLVRFFIGMLFASIHVPEHAPHSDQIVNSFSPS